RSPRPGGSGCCAGAGSSRSVAGVASDSTGPCRGRATTAGSQPLPPGCLYTACRPAGCSCPEMLRTRLLSPLLPAALVLVALAPVAVRAQQAPQQTVIQVENVRTEYARVLRAQPVYQTLRAT